MDNTAVIREYFQQFFSGKARHSLVREYLTDDFRFRGPLMRQIPQMTTSIRSPLPVTNWKCTPMSES